MAARRTFRPGPKPRWGEAGRSKRIARALGVTPVGLSILTKMVATDGIWKGGLASGNPGSGRGPLERAGLITVKDHDNDYTSTITDAGREIVRRARAMGW